MFLTVISEGTEAPAFELPGLVDGAHRRISLEEFVGQDVVVLAFYPADFNPACDAESGLDALDLFTMQKDVSVLAVGPDTLYSHAAFAAKYGLDLPLLSDTRHEVAEAYDVAVEDDVGQRLVERAVAVVDHDGVVQYTWRSPDPAELPPVDAIKAAIADTGNDDTAFDRYRAGYDRYTEGQRAFTSAMSSYEDSEWAPAASGFERAREEFEAAADHFDSAVRFGDDAAFERYYDRVHEKARALWQAADWMAESASEYADGMGAQAQRLRDDAERPLETARSLGEPVAPDDWPPDLDDDASSLQDGTDDELALDVDEEAAAADAVDGDAGTATDGAATADDADRSTGGAGDETGEDAIDDAELEAIEAELAASQPDDPVGGDPSEPPTSAVDAPPGNDDGEGDEIDESDLAALEEEMAASQSAAEEATAREREQATDSEGADDDGETADDPGDGEPTGEDPNDESTDEPPGEPVADPDADLSGGSGSMPPAASGSLEPATGGNDDALEPDDEGDLADEPQGASDDDLADIPTAEELDGDGDPDADGAADGNDRDADGER